MGVVSGIEEGGDHELAKVVSAVISMGSFFGGGEGGEKEGTQDAKDGDGNQHFNEGETFGLGSMSCV